MNDLVRGYYDSMRDNSIMKNLGEAIDIAIAPFKPGRIEAYVSEDFKEFGRSLQVTVESLPDHDFKMPLDIPSMVGEPDGGLQIIYQKVFHHYRYRPSLPVDDHIVLGEE
jgi:hypothetical protein